MPQTPEMHGFAGMCCYSVERLIEKIIELYYKLIKKKPNQYSKAIQDDL